MIISYDSFLKIIKESKLLEVFDRQTGVLYEPFLSITQQLKNTYNIEFKDDSFWRLYFLRYNKKEAEDIPYLKYIYHSNFVKPEEYLDKRGVKLFVGDSVLINNVICEIIGFNEDKYKVRIRRPRVFFQRENLESFYNTSAYPFDLTKVLLPEV